MKKDKYLIQKKLFFRVKCLQQKFQFEIESKDLDFESIAKKENEKGALEYIKVTPRN